MLYTMCTCSLTVIHLLKHYYTHHHINYSRIRNQTWAPSLAQVQTPSDPNPRAPSLAQVQRPSDPNPFRQGHRVLHRFKVPIQTRSDRGTEPCTASNTVRSKPVQTGVPSLAQVQRPSGPNLCRQGHRALHK